MAKMWQKKANIIAMISVILLVLFDQYTKWLASTYLKGKESFVIIKNVFELSYLENRGAAFGILQNQRYFFLVLTFALMIGIVYLFLIMPKTIKYLPLSICMIFVTAGAIGNFIDRLFRGFVVDFFYVSLIDFPIFNVADIYVTVTFFVLILLLCCYYKEEDLAVFSRKD